MWCSFIYNTYASSGRFVCENYHFEIFPRDFSYMCVIIQFDLTFYLIICVQFFMLTRRKYIPTGVSMGSNFYVLI